MSAEEARARCIRLLQAQGVDLPSFKKAVQTDLDSLTGEELLSHQPQRLLDALEDRQARIDSERETEALLSEIRNTQQED